MVCSLEVICSVKGNNLPEISREWNSEIFIVLHESKSRTQILVKRVRDSEKCETKILCRISPSWVLYINRKVRATYHIDR